MGVESGALRGGNTCEEVFSTGEGVEVGVGGPGASYW